MSPPAHTSLIVEIPCQYESDYWEMKDSDLINKVTSKLCEIGWIRKEEIMDALVYPMHYAYPVLELGHENKLERVFHYLKSFRNLVFAGRSSKYEYIHLHDLMKSGREVVEDYRAQFLGKSSLYRAT